MWPIFAPHMGQNGQFNLFFLFLNAFHIYLIYDISQYQVHSKVQDSLFFGGVLANYAIFVPVNIMSKWLNGPYYV